MQRFEATGAQREPVALRARAHGWTRLRGAWRDRQERKIVIGLAALSLGSCGTGGVVAAWTRACAGTCPTAEQIEELRPAAGQPVLDARGGVLGQFYRERRTVIDIDRSPRYVPMAFVAIEDRASSSTRASTRCASWAPCATT